MKPYLDIRRMNNPFGLTDTQAMALDALVIARTQKGAARMLGIGVRTVESRVHFAIKRLRAMGYDWRGATLFAHWDRARRAEGVHLGEVAYTGVAQDAITRETTYTNVVAARGTPVIGTPT